MRILLLVLLTSWAVFAAPASAQHRETVVGLSAGYANAEVEGVAMTLSYARVLGFLRPTAYIEGIASPNEGSRYYRDDFDNGRSACRDSSNGQFTNASNCAAEWTFAARVEGLVRLLRTPVLLGPGVRIGGGEVIPYGTGLWESPLGTGLVLQLKGSAGAEFVQADIGIAFAF
jgi:hypothetical protein